MKICRKLFNEHIKTAYNAVFFLCLTLTFHTAKVVANENVQVFEVTPELDVVIGEVNREILGNNIIGYRDGKISEQFNSYGGGMWDPIRGKPNSEYVMLLKEAGVTMLRWPGGKWRKSMDWKSKMVGANRQPFGLPEFLKLCVDIGAEPVITLSAEYAEEIDIKSLVSYLNAPVSTKKENIWALQREKDGRKLPWSVKWFEYGNENFNSSLSISEYIAGYKEAQKILKRISPIAQLGAVLEDSDNSDSGWSKAVLSELANEMDFGIIHPYIPMVVENAIQAIGFERTIKSSLYADANFEYRLNKLQNVAKESGWNNPLPLAATEYNAHFVQNKPLPIRHTISTAIHNADFIRVMLKPESHLIFANYWHATNGYWGMLKGIPHKRERVKKKPNYYVYYLYNKYLLDTLVSLKFNSPELEFFGAFGVGPRLSNKKDPIVASSTVKLDSKHWQRRIFLGGEQTEENGILKVEFLGHKDVDYYHGYKIFSVKPNSLYRISTRVKTTSLKDGKVGIAVEDAKGWNKNYYQAKNTSLSGTTPWQWLTVEFRTPTDTEKIRVLTRKYKGGGPTKGLAEFGEVALDEMEGDLPSAKLVTGLATISKGQNRLALILINKSLDQSMNVQLNVPLGYRLVGGDSLSGKSTFSHKQKGIVFETLDLTKREITLSPLSVNGFIFAKLIK